MYNCLTQPRLLLQNVPNHATFIRSINPDVE